jgi:type II secretory pathway pseudopilin PulG
MDLRGFTRVELVMTLTALALLALIVLPVLGNTKPRADRVTCANNLRRIGQALQLWASDHFDQDHWRTDVRDGGTYYDPSHPPSSLPAGLALRNNAWFEFVWISNELRTPKILACPSDTRRVATEFTFNPDGGFLYVRYQDAAVSYFLGLDAYLRESRSILAGDRNIRPDAAGVVCSTGVDGVYAINTLPPNPGWNDAIHGPLGNILFHDGQVEQLSTHELIDAFRKIKGDENGQLHFVIPFR